MKIHRIIHNFSKHRIDSIYRIVNIQWFRCIDVYRICIMHTVISSCMGGWHLPDSAVVAIAFMVWLIPESGTCPVWNDRSITLRIPPGNTNPWVTVHLAIIPPLVLLFPLLPPTPSHPISSRFLYFLPSSGERLKPGAIQAVWLNIKWANTTLATRVVSFCL